MSGHPILVSKCFNSKNDTRRHGIWCSLLSLYIVTGVKIEKSIISLKIAHGPKADDKDDAGVVSIGRIGVFMFTVLLMSRMVPVRIALGKYFQEIPFLGGKTKSHKR